MRKAVVIPTYWGRKSSVGWKEGDAIYDHATPINEEGTLRRTLDSLKDSNEKSCKLIILLCPTTKTIEKEAEKKIKAIVEKANTGIETYLFTPSLLEKIKDFLETNNEENKPLDLLKLRGYSNVRNMCLFSTHILASDIAILIDDDEIIEDKDFITKTEAYIGKRIYGEVIYGVAGYYVNKKGEYYDDVSMEPWMTYWDRFGSKSKAFDRIIGEEPRIKQTPFAFGGAMIIHKNLYKLIPFDPNITRGEDIDYLINSKMFGFNFFLDNKLYVKHLPPKKNHPVWQRFREDIHRFMYERAKINSQYPVNNMTIVKPEDFDPYPGEFLKDDLEDKIYKTNVLLSLEYLISDDKEALRETMENVYISKYETVKSKDPFTDYRNIQLNWEYLLTLTTKHRYEIRKMLEKHNLFKETLTKKERKQLSLKEKIGRIKDLKEFNDFTDKEIEELAKLSKIKFFNDNEVVFKEGERDNKLYIVLNGSINIFKYSNSDEEISLANLGEGSFIGESSISTELYYANAKAIGFLTLLSLGQSQIVELIKSQPVLGMKLLQIFVDKLSDKLGRANKVYADYLTHSSHLEI